MTHFIDFVLVAGVALVVACMAIVLVVDYVLERLRARSRQAPTMNDAMREHRHRQNAEHDALDRDIGWS